MSLSDREITHMPLIAVAKPFQQLSYSLNRQLAKRILDSHFSSMQPHLESLEIDRVRDYFKNRALKISSFKILQESERAQINRILEDPKLSRFCHQGDYNLKDYLGVYFPKIDYCFIIKDEELEKYNQHFTTEMTLVHELAHSTGAKFWTSMSVFMEEGFAEKISGHYSSLHMPQDIQEKILKITQKKYKMNAKELTLESCSCEEDKNLHPPLKYHYICKGPYKTDKIDYHHSALAAWGLEMLCKAEPCLEEILMDSRQKLAAINQIPIIINKISPGLYQQLAKAPYTFKGFKNALHEIIRIIYGGKIQWNSRHELVAP